MSIKKWKNEFPKNWLCFVVGVTYRKGILAITVARRTDSFLWDTKGRKYHVNLGALKDGTRCENIHAPSIPKYIVIFANQS